MSEQSLLTIDEAQIIFFSHYYDHLQCKIIQNDTNQVICSKLINKCFQTYFNINRDLEQIHVELFQKSNLIGSFFFTQQDLNQVVDQDVLRNQLRIFKKRRRFVKFKKQNDSCSLFFTIELKGNIFSNQNATEIYIYQQYIRSIASKVYKQLENIALNRINKSQFNKFKDKRLSLTEQTKFIKLDTNKCLAIHASNIFSYTFNQNIKPTEDKKTEVFKNWNEAQNKMIKIGKKPVNNKKNSSKSNEKNIKIVRQRAKKLFGKEIKQRQKNQQIIIPHIEHNKKHIRLLSEGIVFPEKFRKQKINQAGVKFDGLMQNPMRFSEGTLQSSRFANSRLHPSIQIKKIKKAKVFFVNTQNSKISKQRSTVIEMYKTKQQKQIQNKAKMKLLQKKPKLFKVSNLLEIVFNQNE